MIYRVGERVHVHGDTICRASFSHDTSGARLDVIDPIVMGVDDDVRLVPLGYCEKCQHERLSLRGILN